MEMEKESSQLTAASFFSGNCQFLGYMSELYQQNEYLKQALETAESLITNYQQQNKGLSKQIKAINEKMRQVQQKCQLLQETIYRLQVKGKLAIQNKETEKVQSVDQLNAKIHSLTNAQEKYEQKIQEMQNKIARLERVQSYQKINNKQPIQTTRFSLRALMNKTDQSKKFKSISELQELYKKISIKEINAEKSQLMDKRVFSKQKKTNWTLSKTKQ